MIIAPNLVYSDTSDLVYYQIMDMETSEILWSENKEEQAAIEENNRVALLQKKSKYIFGVLVDPKN